VPFVASGVVPEGVQFVLAYGIACAGVVELAGLALDRDQPAVGSADAHGVGPVIRLRRTGEHRPAVGPVLPAPAGCKIPFPDVRPGCGNSLLQPDPVTGTIPAGRDLIKRRGDSL
jgi:hypothetical protein